MIEKKGVTLLSTSEPYQILWTRHVKGKRFVQLTAHKHLGLIFSTGKYLATKPNEVTSWVLDNNVLNLFRPKEGLTQIE